MNSLIVCARVDDLPQEAAAPGSEERWCQFCSIPVWVSPASIALMAKKPKLLPTCFTCAARAAKSEFGNIKVRITPGSAEALRAAGVSKAETSRFLYALRTKLNKGKRRK